MNKKILASFLAILSWTVIGCESNTEMDEVEEKNEAETEQVKEIINPKKEEFNNQAMVTFAYDDGKLSNYEEALPLHEEYKMPATFYIIGKRAIPDSDLDEFLTIDMIKDSFERGVDIGSHTYYHDNLTEKDDEELHFEMSESKEAIEKIIGEGTVKTVAIPYSKHNEKVKEIAKEYYDGMRIHENTLNEIPKEDPHALYSAIAPLNDTTFEDIKEQIDNAVAENKWAVIMLHGIDKDKEHRFEITPDLLEEVLKYVNTFDREELLPINIADALEYME